MVCDYEFKHVQKMFIHISSKSGQINKDKMILQMQMILTLRVLEVHS